MTDYNDEARGWSQIGAVLDVCDKTAKKLADAGALPVYFIGRTPCMRRSTWNTVVQERERSALVPTC